MGRALRIEYPGAFYHVTSRGNRAQPIFLVDRDRYRFIEYLQDAINKFNVRIHSYVLMTNHYHLLLETPLGNLSRCMHFVNLAYTNYFNKKHKQVGHVLQGRYTAILIDKDNYLLTVSRYIHLNPVRAGLVNRPQDYFWSSYRKYVVLQHSWLWKNDILNRFSKNNREGIRRYRRFVEQESDEKSLNPFLNVKSGTILGDDDFVEQALEKVKDKKISREVPAYKQLIKRPDKEKIIEFVAQYFRIDRESILKKGRGNTAKKVAIYLMRKYSDCTLREIAELFGGLTYSACGKIVARLEDQKETDRVIAKAIAELSVKMSNVKI